MSEFHWVKIKDLGSCSYVWSLCPTWYRPDPPPPGHQMKRGYEYPGSGPWRVYGGY